MSMEPARSPRSGSAPREGDGTLECQNRRCPGGCNGFVLVAGTSLLVLVVDRALGLTGGRGGRRPRGGMCERQGGHEPGRVFSEGAVMLADGGRCEKHLAD